MLVCGVDKTRIGPDRTGPDHGSDHGPDRGWDHGSDRGSDHGKKKVLKKKNNQILYKIIINKK